MNFAEKLDAIIEKNNSLLCIGLDPEVDKLPKHLLSTEDPIFTFNVEIIRATHDLVCAYKPNIAFYEAYGLEGLQSLKRTMEFLQDAYPDIPIVLDAKRADIGNTAKMYAKAAFEYWDADAVTVHPNLGLDSLIPFFQYKDKLTIILMKTSNPDSGMFQDLLVNNKPYYIAVAEEIKKWPYENIGIFVGATYPTHLKEMRQIFPNNIFLSAGLGAQGGSVQQAVTAGIDKNKKGIMLNAGRSALYSSPSDDFAEKAREEAQKLKDEINTCRMS